ncbi:MAG: hypothetical protein ACI4I2_04425 [Oscillospiraceae bacterium]
MKNEMEYCLNDNVIISEKINNMSREELEKAIQQKEAEIKAKNSK